MGKTDEKLRALRERAGLSRDALAARLGYSHGTAIQRYEEPAAYAKREHLRLDLALKLADVFVGMGSPPITREEVLDLAGATDVALDRKLLRDAIAAVYVEAQEIGAELSPEDFSGACIDIYDALSRIAKSGDNTSPISKPLARFAIDKLH